MAENVMEDDIEELDDDEEEGQGSSFIKYLIIGVVALLLLSAAGFGFLYFTGDSAEEVTDATQGSAKEDAKQDKAPAEPKAPMQYHSLSPAFVVNFSGDNGGRFLQVSLEVGARDPLVLDRIREHSPLIRNNLVLLFGSQDPDKLSTREGKEQLRAELLAEVNAVLKAETGSSGIDGVFFTSFVMQ